eukprot:CAMPEP_0180562550 /NCGR_PEP_ID=MMETSP1037_2-20121125/3977_1 /TAXON_ID=632150 /ORGANISM="Azadinium spinosum, Strain 3D9" /LENGTH=43 /DNA_ID= /DNA_START= /DNA_END= /DNA_ORIENTATION=
MAETRGDALLGPPRHRQMSGSSMHAPGRARFQDGAAPLGDHAS